jgi:hypothetical protein
LVLPAEPATGANVIRVGNNITISSVGYGTVVTGDSMTFVNGRLVGGTNIRTVAAAEPVRMFVTLPAGSRIDARMKAGKLTVRGHLHEVRFNSAAADIDAESVGYLRARTMSGDIIAAKLTGASAVRTMSGDIAIDEALDPVTAQTMSGNITIGTSEDIDIDADSMSGNITVRPYGGANPDVRAHSMSGNVRTRHGGAR